jgi:hypothetical protein
LYGGNDTIQNEADIAAYNNKPSSLGVKHGQIFDAAETSAGVLGVAAGGLGVAGGGATLSRVGGAAKSKVIGREGLAGWYKEQGEYFQDVKKLESHMEGTDFSRPVTLKTLPENTELIQFVRKDGKPGMYFARPGTPMESLGIKEPPPRVVRNFIVKKPIDVVESTSATLEKELAPGVGGAGGGQQLIFPKGWEDFVQPF